MIVVRPALSLDAPEMAQLLNKIIAIGGTTALVRPVTAQDLKDWMAFAADKSAWHVALEDAAFNGSAHIRNFQRRRVISPAL